MTDAGAYYRMLRESFAPVVVLAMAMFAVLMYVQYRSGREAADVTVIDVGTVAIAPDREALFASDADQPQIVSQTGDEPEQVAAAALAKAGRLDEAERMLRSIVGREPGSRVLADLGRIYLQKGDLRQALKYFDRALSADPANSGARFSRGVALMRAGRSDEAIGEYRNIIAGNPYHFEAQRNLGLALLAREDFAGAAGVLEKAAQLAGGERKARALHSLALAYKGLGDRDRARRSFEDVIRLRPDDMDARLGMVALEPATPEGRERAMAVLRKILELKPNEPRAHFQMAHALSALGRKREAEQAYRRAIQFNPEYANAHYNLGLLLLGERRWADAFEQFEWVAAHEPQRAEAHFNLGRVAFGQGDYERAGAAYRHAIDLRHGHYPEAHLNLGLVHATLKDYERASSAYRNAIKERPDYSEAWYNLGLAYLKQKKLGEAENAFLTAVRHDAKYAQSWFNLGVLYGEAGRDADAVEAYRHALRVRPEYPQAQLNLAVRYGRMERHAEAIALYRDLLARDDTYALAWLNLGISLLDIRDSREAVRALRRAAQLDPSDAKTLRYLGRALLSDDRPSEAVATLEQAVSAEAADARLRLELAKAYRAAGRADDARDQLEKANQLDPENKEILRELAREWP